MGIYVRIQRNQNCRMDGANFIVAVFLHNSSKIPTTKANGFAYQFLTLAIIESCGFTVIDKGAGTPSIAFGGLTQPCLRGLLLLGRTSYPASCKR